jgi:hypothetical protein
MLVPRPWGACAVLVRCLCGACAVLVRCLCSSVCGDCGGYAESPAQSHDGEREPPNIARQPSLLCGRLCTSVPTAAAFASLVDKHFLQSR